MTFDEVIHKLRDGKAYRFTHPHLKGYFYKAPYPVEEAQTAIDSAASAITFWHEGKRAMPTLMLYDFDENDWTCVEVDRHPLA